MARKDELEAELVVAFPRAAVHDRVRVELERDLRHRGRDHGPRQRRDEGIAALVQGVRLERLCHLLLGERLLAVDEQDVGCTCSHAAHDRRLDVERLPDVDEHRDHLIEA